MIVLDATLLANVVGDDAEDGYLARSILADSPLAAIPQVAELECLAVLRKRWIARMLDDERLTAAAYDLKDLPLRRYPVTSLLDRIIELRHNVSPYDASYVALAESLDARFVTADKRLAGATGPKCEFQVVAPSTP